MTTIFQHEDFIIYQFLAGRDFSNDKSERLNVMAYQMANYIYLIVYKNEAIVIDGSWDTKSIFNFCKQRQYTITKALVTHRHFDHTGGIMPAKYGFGDMYSPGVKEYIDLGIPVFVGQDDLQAVSKQCRVNPSQLTPLKDLFILEVQGKRIQALHTPGHTSGSFCFLVESRFLFTGDTLFIGSCGRIDLPESNPNHMLESLKKLSSLDPNILVLPGHNYAAPNKSTIKEEKIINGAMIQAMSVGLSVNNTSARYEKEVLTLNEFIPVAVEVLEETVENCCSRM